MNQRSQSEFLHEIPRVRWCAQLDVGVVEVAVHVAAVRAWRMLRVDPHRVSGQLRGLTAFMRPEG